MVVPTAILLGLAVGSFLNVCIGRLPRGESVVRPPSRCPECGRPIVWYDNVPVVSYLVLGARCRRCRASISARYPVVEILTALIAGVLAVRHGLGPAWAFHLAFAAAMIVLAAIDLDHRILPDSITLNGIWIGVLANVYLGAPNPLAQGLLGLAGMEHPHPRVAALVGSLAGLIAGGGLLWAVREAFFRLRGVEGMGLGDVKMMAMVGACLGLPLALLTLVLGSVSGAVIGTIFMRLSGKSRDYELPFGTFLGAAAVVAAVSGNEIVRAYMDGVLPPG